MRHDIPPRLDRIQLLIMLMIRPTRRTILTQISPRIYFLSRSALPPLPSSRYLGLPSGSIYTLLTQPLLCSAGKLISSFKLYNLSLPS